VSVYSTYRFQSGRLVGTLRHTRYQAAIIEDGAILLLRCAFRDGPAMWMLPGGGREDDEEETTCVIREVQEETNLAVRVETLLSDVPAEPADGTYVRWRTYRCAVVSGDAAPGGGEGAGADLVGVIWLPIHDDGAWPADILADVFLYPQLKAIQRALRT
jgi:8-oxo-dGTP pyrophosphatase MutT (NUDIX family)